MLKTIMKIFMYWVLAGLAVGVVSAFLGWQAGQDAWEWFLAGILPFAMILIFALGLLLFVAILWGFLDSILRSWFR